MLSLLRVSGGKNQSVRPTTFLPQGSGENLLLNSLRLVVELGSLWLYNLTPCFLVGCQSCSLRLPSIFIMSKEELSRVESLWHWISFTRKSPVPFRADSISSGPHRQSPHLKANWFETSITWAKPANAVPRLVLPTSLGKAVSTPEWEPWGSFQSCFLQQTRWDYNLSNRN